MNNKICNVVSCNGSFYSSLRLWILITNLPHAGNPSPDPTCMDTATYMAKSDIS